MGWRKKDEPREISAEAEGRKRSPKCEFCHGKPGDGNCDACGGNGRIVDKRLGR